jgi:hemerythrin superfamily protein
MIARGASETPDSEEDVVDVLLGQHMRIRDLFDEVRLAKGERRQDAFDRLVRLLAMHETAEEQVLHPLARWHVDGGNGLVDDRLAEERQAKKLLSALESMGVGSPDFGRLLEELRMAVLQHAHNEEQYEFPQLRQQCSAIELRAMAKLLRVSELLAPTHPHPGIESATRNFVLGPGVALFDRIRDEVNRIIARDQVRVGR